MMGRWVPAVPLLLSLALSAGTVGTHLYWQDSGFYLAAVKSLGILYPTGFTLYLLSCKAWTTILFFVDFTLAVHLFSSLCAALAAGTLSLAARELLLTRGPVFRTSGAEPGRAVDLASCAAGCLAASAYTFWSAALLAKVYAFYYLILALLLWRMIRADASGTRRDFMIVAALIGLAWQAHPSATNTGAALVLFLAAHRRTLGAAGLARGAALAALLALGPFLLLPWLASRDPDLMFGDPRSASALWEYVSGGRFIGVPGVFGFTGSRVRSVGVYGAEEFLGVGAVAVVAGLVRLGSLNRRLLLGVAAWVLPVLIVTVLFKMEGQHDLWFVAAWIPLWLVAAVGLHGLAVRAPAAAAAAALAGVAWAGLANRADLDVRRFDLPEQLGRLYLDALDPGAVLILRSDNPLAAVQYLQQVQGLRPDVVVLSQGLLGTPWYDARLERRHPFLHAAPDVVAFANRNGLDPAHPIFFEIAPPAETLRADAALRFAGTLVKLAPQGAPEIDPKYWRLPLEPEAVAKRLRRERAQFNEHRPDGVRVRPESNEHRFLRDLLRARKHFADALLRSGSPDAFRRAAELYETLIALDPWMGEEAGAVYPLAGAYFGMKRYDLAEPWLRRALELPDLPPNARVQVLEFLAVIEKSR